MLAAGFLIALMACEAAKDTPEATTDLSGGLLGGGLSDPFPSSFLIEDGRVAIPADLLPDTPTPLPVERLAWRTGFSPVQTSVVRLPGVDASKLPTWYDGWMDGAVQLWDLDSGTQLPVFAELDSYPQDNPSPALLIRPQAPMPVGHRIAVVIYDDLCPRPDRFDAILSGDDPADFTGGGPAIRRLVGELEALGIDAAHLALAWDFPVGEGRTPLLDGATKLQPATGWDFYRVNNADDGDPVPSSAWKVSQGRLQVQNFLVDDTLLNLDSATGVVAADGMVEADIYVHVPQSVKSAPAGSVPVLFFGHGIFGTPQGHLGYYSSAVEIADKEGFILVATTWRGLSENELADALIVGRDMGQLPMLTDRLVQSQLTYRSILLAITQGDLLSDAAFAGESGQRLADSGTLLFYGVSMGGIEGGVFTALNPEIQASAFHVPGSTWSVLLERSVSWVIFEGLMLDALPDPRDRQVMLAASQLWWDPVDPAAWVPDLQDRLILVQENLYDDTVSNLGTRILARGLGLPLLDPAADPPPGLTLVDGPLPAGSRAMVQLDPGVAAPPDGNRPAPETGGHGGTEGWAAARDQLREFLRPGQLGTVILPCGDVICTPETAE